MLKDPILVNYLIISHISSVTEKSFVFRRDCKQKRRKKFRTPIRNDPYSMEKGLHTFAKSFGPCQPVRNAQADNG